MMKKVQKCLTLLKKLRIEFDRCLEITDDGLVDLCKVLKGAVSLKDLDVSFGNWYKIADEGVMVNCMKNCFIFKRLSIRQLLKSRTSLKKIRLNTLLMMATTDEVYDKFLKENDNLKTRMAGLEIKCRN